MRSILELDDAAILVRDDGTIEAVGPASSFDIHHSSFELVDCRGLVALPGFVDSHTHCAFAGERSAEAAMRAEGRSYQEIAQMGGGIRSSVEQVRAASIDDIVTYSKPFAQRALALGTTTMEIKSGYGLSTSDERKLLEAAARLGSETSMEVIVTYLGAHAVPKNKSQTEYVEEIVAEQLPTLHGLAEFCDVFMDEGYFTRAETIRICIRAKELGLKIKLHADELAETNGARTAAELGAFSADHLLKISDDGIGALASSERTVATLLPITALSLRAPYAPARKLIDAGCAVAIATDCNPGSAMSENMQLAISLAVFGMQMTPAEALCAATINGAAALDRASTHGSIERNKLADFVLCYIPRLEYLPYHVGVSDVVSVVKAGKIVYGDRI
ncbi:MAG: imidazolonepropionase [Bacteroidota bacterium]|nr:imidazolonepropionase [Bacteroidota bacterium]MDP4231782.1 imidazolonepropionase [Bacteroidota bacterium]MDP4287119.1 imidazolonepropionase [Bacteroidota bacterium]